MVVVRRGNTYKCIVQREGERERDTEEKQVCAWACIGVVLIIFSVTVFFITTTITNDVIIFIITT